jgi:hypothetical protein
VTKRRSVGLLLIALGTIAVSLSFSASPADAQAPDQAGWWFELKTKAVPVPIAVPTVPDGGLFVQQGPNGPTAYGAVRARVPGVASVTLILTAAQGSTTTLGAPLQACATSAQWAPTSPAPGDWEDAPKYGNPCTFGAVSSDGKAVAFYFETQFFPSGVLDVAIVPRDGATPFAIAFDKPAGDSITTKVATVPAPSPITKPPAAGNPAPVSSGGGKSPTVASPVATPAPTPTTLVRSDAGRAPIANNVLKLAGLGDPDRGARAASLGGASVIVVGWWLLSTQSVRLPRLLGGMGGAVATDDDAIPATSTRMGGVARFARKRDRNPLKLR